MALNEADYAYLSNLVLSRSGLALGEGKDYLLEARLIPLAQTWGLLSIEELIAELKRRNDERLASAVTEAMTTNESLFFRDKSPFDELASTVFPALMEARRHHRTLRIWSAATSTGQEAYSVAMVLHDSFPQLKDWKIEIVGTDISSQALARAIDGIYTQFEVQRGLPITLLMKHFEQTPKGWSVRRPLRERVRFEKLNLLEAFQHLGLFDVVLCRNVLIYFETAAKKQILERMVRQMRPDGYLLLGAAESTMGVTDALERQRTLRSGFYSPRATASPRVTALSPSTR